MDTDERNNVPVVIFFNDGHHVIDCSPQKTLAQVRDVWHAQLGDSPSVAFLLANDRFLSDVLASERFLLDDMTVDEALQETGTSSLELHARLRTAFWIELFGYEDTKTPFQVVPCLSPSAVRRQIVRALDVLKEDFRLTCGETVLDQEQPFEALNVSDEDLLTIDLALEVRVNVRSEQEEPLTKDYFSSTTIGDLRQSLNLDKNQVIVAATAPYHRLLSDPLRLCHVVSDKSELGLPIDLLVERKVLVPFEPITLDHLRQELLIAPSATPCELYGEVSERFELTCEFRLTVHGEPLDNWVPLKSQVFDPETVIQIDIVRPCVVEDRWRDYFEERRDEVVFLYSTESVQALTMRDVEDDQRLFYDDIQRTLFGTMTDVFGAVGGSCWPGLVVDRDVHRNVPFILCNTIERRRAWARDILGDIAPLKPSQPPKELMSCGALAAHKESMRDLCLTEHYLVIKDPLKIAVDYEKRLRLCRFSRRSIFSDIRAHMEQALSCQNLRLRSNQRAFDEEAINRKMDLELLLLESSSRHRTRLEVTLRGTTHQCWFESSEVSFSDVMINIGRQAKIPPRHLFCCSLFCRGCGRRISKEEEPFQSLPASCCSVRSMKLTDRRVRDVGIQTAVPRSREVALDTLYPESRDAAASTMSEVGRAIVSATPDYAAESKAATVGRSVVRDTPDCDRIAHLRIDCHDDPQEAFDLDFHVRGALLGRVVLAKVAEKRGKRIEEMKLMQCRWQKRKDKKAVLYVAEESSSRWADESGQEVEGDELEYDKRHVIDEDDTVLTAGPRRTWVRIESKQP